MSTLKIKRNTQNSDAPENTQLVRGELAFNETEQSLFIGSGDNGAGKAGSVVNLGGKGLFVDKSTEQTDIGGNKTFTDNVTISGDLTVNGDTTTVSTTNTTVSDNIFELNSGASSNTNDCGIMIERGSAGANAFIGWDESEDKFILGTTTAAANSTGNLTITAGTIQANITGSASQLTTARNIELIGDVTGNANFNGTADIDINATIASQSVEKGMTNFVSDSTTDGAGLVIKGTPSNQTNSSDAYIKLNCSQNTHGIKLKSPPHSAGANYTLTFPNNDGDANQVLQTNGSGVLSWVDQTTDTNTQLSDEQVQDIVGAMVTGNTETGITVSYADNGASAGKLNFVIGTLNQDTTGNAASATTSTKVTVTDNESTNENNLIAFVADAATTTGSQSLEMDGNLTYNPNTGKLTATTVEATIDGGTYT